MFNIRKYETYSWDAVNNISKEQVEEFIKLLQYQLNLDVVKPIVVERKSELSFEIADRSTVKKLTWDDAVAHVKSLGDGWRLPTIEELNRIYNSENDFVGSCYWSSTECNGYSAWGQDMSDGDQFNYYKGYSSYVRAVRDIIKQNPTLPFEIADKSTEKELTWNEAITYVKSLGDGWRLPTKEELKVIYYTCQPYHYLPRNMFVNSYYWSAIEDSSDLAWFMDMSNGYAYSGFKGNHGYVRAVRDVS